MEGCTLTPKKSQSGAKLSKVLKKVLQWAFFEHTASDILFCFGAFTEFRVHEDTLSNLFLHMILSLSKLSSFEKCPWKKFCLMEKKIAIFGKFLSKVNT